MHPTVKPVALVADAIRDCSRRRGIVLDLLPRQRHHPDRGRAHRPARPTPSSSTRAMSMSRSGVGRSTPARRRSSPPAAVLRRRRPGASCRDRGGPIRHSPGRRSCRLTMRSATAGRPSTAASSKGQSGNPKGRAKGTQDLATDLQGGAGRAHPRARGRAAEAGQQAAGRWSSACSTKSLKGEIGALRILLDLIIRLADRGADEPIARAAHGRGARAAGRSEARLRRRASHRWRIGETRKLSHRLRTLSGRCCPHRLPTFVHRAFQTVSPGVPFQPNWHVELLADRLEACRSGTIKRLLICLPPRQLKSLCASVAFPAWALGHDPSRRIICASYSLDLAAKLARDCRAVLESTWYRRLFPRCGLRVPASSS